jgi:glutaredoxin
MAHKLNQSVLLILLLLGLFALTPSAQASEADMIYFGSRFCVSCARVENEGVFDSLIEQGYNITKYYLEDDASYLGLLRDYQATYGLSLDSVSTPIIFLGSQSFGGEEPMS